MLIMSMVIITCCRVLLRWLLLITALRVGSSALFRFGCAVCQGDYQPYEIKAIVDRVGGGDSFAAGNVLLAAATLGWSLLAVLPPSYYSLGLVFACCAAIALCCPSLLCMLC